ncbi:Hydroxypyruvate reductase [Caprobacter fermentans]|uniref:Hydroxyacid dehydrogenase n=1 Tax=Caproicibacter fermentans TaxID=2576756 RepID=A0A6N8I5J7_9FIRM|nr:hydroxyacid dehydrogenase [Caproicibacter fermentans]MVB12793.1 Hydroxypyruvate reductase [Caproicibacter fermentans]OCN01562.1 oxidoreductase [Clostridium sp. W14A]QNK40320.1 hydroxyacid dehydrogenase [Caproicibacter fermentans]
MKVLFLKEMDRSAKDILVKNGIQVIVSHSRSEADYVREIQRDQVDGIFCRTEEVTPAMMGASARLKVIAKQGVGLDNIDVPYATNNGIQVVYAPGGNANSVAEHTIFLMLACARRFNYVDGIFRAGNAEVRYTLHDTFELKGMTLGLLGCGRIGQLVAQKAARGFGMNVIGYDPYLKQDALDAAITLKKRKEEVLRESDFISLHMPSTPQTRGTVGAADFALMKPTASFINAARGDVVVEKDLILALQSGRILGAGVDVYAHEPIGPDHALLKMPQVIATPHTAATTEQSVKKCCSMAAQGIVEVLTGQKISFPANHPKMVS